MVASPSAAARGRARGNARAIRRVAVGPVDAEHVRPVNTHLRRRDRVDAIAIPQVSEQALGDRLVKHSGLEALEIRQRFCVALTGLLRVNTGVSGHWTNLIRTP